MVRLVVCLLLVASTSVAASVKLSWEHDRTDCQYRVYIQQPVKHLGFANYSTLPAGSRTVTFTGISSSHKYAFKVTAIDPVYGTESSDSNKVLINVPVIKLRLSPKGNIR